MLLVLRTGVKWFGFDHEKLRNYKAAERDTRLPGIKQGPRQFSVLHLRIVQAWRVSRMGCQSRNRGQSPERNFARYAASDVPVHAQA
jgi:hypothetical protein